MEALRIFAMFAIIAFHLVKIGALADLHPNPPTEILVKGSISNRVFAAALLPGGDVGVALFFMLTGYYLSNAKRCSIRKIVLTTVFYGWLFGLTGLVAKAAGASIPAFAMKSIQTPVTGNVWWFITSYVALMFLLPALNGLLAKLTTSGVLFVAASVYLFWIWRSSFFYFGIPRAVFFYLIGAVCHRKETRIVTPVNHVAWLSLALLSWIVETLLILPPLIRPERCAPLLAPPVLATATTAYFVFRLFRSFAPRNRPFVNLLASTTFGIYLIHDHPMIRTVLWNNWLGVSGQLFPSRLFPLWAILLTVCVFSICALLEIARLRFVAPGLERFANTAATAFFLRFGMTSAETKPGLEVN